MKKNMIWSRRGFGLIEVLVAIGLLAVVAAGISGLSNIMFKSQVQSNVTFQADSFRRQLMSNINNSAAWLATYSDSTNNGNLQCLQAGKSCTILAAAVPPATRSTPSPFYMVYDPSGKKFYDGSPGHGLSSSGAPCTGFNATPGSGNDQCPYQFQLGFIPHCTVGANTPGSSCAAANTQAEIVVTAVYNPGSAAKSVAFNSNNYSADFYQGASNLACSWDNNGGNLAETCATTVVVGSLSPSAIGYALDVVGVGNFSVGLRSPYLDYHSDSRLKTDLQPMQGMLHEIESLHAVRFRWNETASRFGLKGDENHFGFLAQDVEKFFPEAVRTDKDGFKTVDYPLMVVPAMQAIKELQQQNAMLLKRIQALEDAR